MAIIYPKPLAIDWTMVVHGSTAYRVVGLAAVKDGTCYKLVETGIEEPNAHVVMLTVISEHFQTLMDGDLYYTIIRADFNYVDNTIDAVVDQNDGKTFIGGDNAA